MANRVIHFDITADDVERAKTFYEKALGWKIEMYPAPEGSNMQYFGITTGPEGTPGINGGMMKRGPENKSRSFEATILVDDIDKAVEAVKANGGTVTREKSEMKGVGWFAGARDTEGNNFNIMQATDWQPK
jgi:uncharacterized protein